MRPHFLYGGGVQLEPARTVQWIFWCWGDLHPDRHLGFRSAVVEAMFDIARCGTGALGWREYRCWEHGTESRPNTCRRRDCPQCIGDRAFRWAGAMEGRLLDCPHFHVVATLSDVLNPHWRHNRSAMADILFQAISAALQGLLRSPRHMGGTPAILVVLHTHGGALVLHPHVHVIVSLVGLSPDGTLVRAKRKTLLPYRVLRRAFQNAFLHRLKELASRPDFHLPKGTTARQFRLLLDKLFAQSQANWNVRIFRRDDVRPVLFYLSRTVYGGPIRNDRIVSVDAESVSLRYADWRHREEGGGLAPPMTICRLTLDDFVARYSEHVLEPGFNCVRHYGLFAPGNRELLDAARALLLQSALPMERSADDPPAPEPLVRCKRCQQPMLLVRELPPTQVVLSPTAHLSLHARASPFLRWEAAA